MTRCRRVSEAVAKILCSNWETENEQCFCLYFVEILLEVKELYLPLVAPSEARMAEYERNQDAAGQAIWGTLNQEGTAWVGRDNGHARLTPCPVSRDSSFPVRLCFSSTRNVLRGRVTGEKGLARHHGFAIQLLQ